MKTRPTGTPLPDDYFRPYPGYSSIYDLEWGNNANSNSLQVTFNRRMSHGLAYGVAYTYSKALDDRRSTTYASHSLTYGPSSTDMRNRLTPNWVWALPKVSTHFGQRVQPVGFGQLGGLRDRLLHLWATNEGRLEHDKQ